MPGLRDDRVFPVLSAADDRFRSDSHVKRETGRLDPLRCRPGRRPLARRHTTTPRSSWRRSRYRPLERAPPLHRQPPIVRTSRDHDCSCVELGAIGQAQHDRAIGRLTPLHDAGGHDGGTELCGLHDRCASVRSGRSRAILASFAFPFCVSRSADESVASGAPKRPSQAKREANAG